MYRLPYIILFFFAFTIGYAQSPHGDALKIDCNKCHNPSGWQLDSNLMRFNHNSTEFKLEGAHTQTDCKSCHTKLVFNQTTSDCASCHTDIHSGSVGNDCVRCHTSQSWLVDNVTEIHEDNGFPLVGVHSTLSCIDCHTSETDLRFDRIGNDCVSCHNDDYLATTSPNHVSAGYSMDCTECHDPFGDGWQSQNINHGFFPLTLGHSGLDCMQCHTTGNYADADPNCVSCHQTDYNNTNEPDHQAAGFSTDCMNCHTTNPGWTPAEINHDFFPLTLGHAGVDCMQCHTTGNYSDADPNCVSCHQTDYNNTNDPDHQASGFSTDCASCHTTNPGWSPADINHDFFPLTLGHSGIDCMQCHTTVNYADADPNCVSCHQTDFNNTNDPDHQAANFPTDCVTCHTTNPNWIPTSWDHDGNYFPIYSGKHDNEWDTCTDCHTNPNNYATFSCFACHQENVTNNIHDQPDDPEFEGYIYESNACLECHPDGSG